MKKYFRWASPIVLLWVFVAVGFAMVAKYNTTLVNEAGLTYNKNYTLNIGGVNGIGVDFLSFTATCSSTTFATDTFTDTAFVPPSPIIVIPSHGYTTGLPVVYTSTNAIGGITTSNTYYVIALTPNAIELATTSARAVSGNYVTITSSNTGTTYTLTPATITGNTSYKWQVSNDGMNWFDYTVTDQGVAVSSVTISTYLSTGTYNAWDFGEIDYAYIRLAVTSPTAGGVKLVVTGNGKNSTQ